MLTLGVDYEFDSETNTLVLPVPFEDENAAVGIGFGVALASAPTHDYPITATITGENCSFGGFTTTLQQNQPKIFAGAEVPIKAREICTCWRSRTDLATQLKFTEVLMNQDQK
ncbi:MAG: hypothetical protein LBP35_04110 [Candidatus Ancillula trichonymphae]|jgi:hypothetical protein|nr:hypothetical protein [Candidatus Ancillula trichonymphae]